MNNINKLINWKLGANKCVTILISILIFIFISFHFCYSDQESQSDPTNTLYRNSLWFNPITVGGGGRIPPPTLYSYFFLRSS